MGEKDTCTRMAEPLRCSPETTTRLLTDYTPIRYKKSEKNKKLPVSTLAFTSLLTLEYDRGKEELKEEENRLQAEDYDETGGVI